jgi:DNA-binding response OmpR family regulator
LPARGEFATVYEEFKPDILLLDVELGDGNGIEICRNLRSRLDKESLFIVILTAYDDADSIEMAYQAGANDYIRKPFLPYEISAKVQQMSKIIQYQNSILDLYNRQKQFNQRLYRLGRIINKSINYTKTKDLLESVEHISTVIPVDSMELHLERSLIFSRTFTEDFNHVPLSALEHKIPPDDGKRLIRMRQLAGEEPVNIVVARVVYNKTERVSSA